MSESLMDGRVCVITGANSGIGFVTARELARMGAKVVMVCRNGEKCDAAKSAIVKATGNTVDTIIADLASFDSVRRLVKELQSKYEKIHVLINNAG